MPHIAAAKAAVCTTHGRRCRVAGGSAYRSVFCAAVPDPGPGVEEAEMRAVREEIRVARARAGVLHGMPVEEAEAAAQEQWQAEEDEAARWSKLPCRAIDDEISRRWAALSPEVRGSEKLEGLLMLLEFEVAQIVHDAKGRFRAEQEAAAEESARVAALIAASDQHERHHSSQERAPGAVGPAPAPGVAGSAQEGTRSPRRRPGRRPRLIVVRDDGFEDDEGPGGYFQF
jgi:hypothetical protein